MEVGTFISPFAESIVDPAGIFVLSINRVLSAFTVGSICAVTCFGISFPAAKVASSTFFGTLKGIVPSGAVFSPRARLFWSTSSLVSFFREDFSEVVLEAVLVREIFQSIDSGSAPFTAT